MVAVCGVVRVFSLQILPYVISQYSTGFSQIA